MKKNNNLILLICLSLATIAIATPLSQFNANHSLSNTSTIVSLENQDTNIDSKTQYDLSLLLNSIYVANNINVTVYKGHVLLTGQVTSILIKRQAGQKAHNHPNVVEVINYLTVEHNESTENIKQDKLLANKINDKLLKVGDIKRNKLKVVVTQNKVYIIGNVTHDQAVIIVKTLKALNLTSEITLLFI